MNPPLTQVERRARTRATLMDAAYRVFSRDGYHRATLEAIATEAGVSKGAVYHNFKTKQDLFYALLDERLAERAEQIQRGAPMPADREWNLLFWEFACTAARDPEPGRRLAGQLQAFRAGAAEQIERMLAEAGVTSTVPAERIARIVAAIANGLALDLLLDPDAQAEGEETMTTAIDLLWRAATNNGERNDAA